MQMVLLDVVDEELTSVEKNIVKTIGKSSVILRGRYDSVFKTL